jgi:hypothetical protein
LELGCVAVVDSNGRTIFVADTHDGDGQRFIVRADERLTAFVEVESAIRGAASLINHVVEPLWHKVRTYMQIRLRPTHK